MKTTTKLTYKNQQKQLSCVSGMTYSTVAKWDDEKFLMSIGKDDKICSNEKSSSGQRRRGRKLNSRYGSKMRFVCGCWAKTRRSAGSTDNCLCSQNWKRHKKLGKFFVCFCLVYAKLNLQSQMGKTLCCIILHSHANVLHQIKIKYQLFFLCCIQQCVHCMLWFGAHM